MKPAEQGFLLLTSRLGDPDCKCLTVAQFRSLISRVRAADRSEEDRALTMDDLIAIGCGRDQAERILFLLSRQEQLEYYVNQAKKQDCYPLTRISEGYPGVLRRRLGNDCPGCLWLKGDSSLLCKPAVSMVGSRVLREDNTAFAREVGRQAAEQGYVLISGNARGADQTAQNSCLEHGGQVISIVADSLADHPMQDGVLYISEDGFDMPFSPLRALSRNRLIHAMGAVTLVAQCSLETGGTWDGSLQNLRKGWSVLCVYADGSEGANALLSRGAVPVDLQALSDLKALTRHKLSLFE